MDCGVIFWSPMHWSRQLINGNIHISTPLSLKNIYLWIAKKTHLRCLLLPRGASMPLRRLEVAPNLNVEINAHGGTQEKQD